MNEGQSDDEILRSNHHCKNVEDARAVASELWVNEVCQRIVPDLAQELKLPASGRDCGRLGKVRSLLCGTLQDIFVKMKLPMQLDESISWDATGGVSPPPELAGLLGRILAEAVIIEPDGATIAGELIRDDFVARDVMIEIMRDAFQSSNQGRDAVLTALRGIVKNIAEHPEIGLFTQEQGGFLEFLCQWKSAQDLDCVFGRKFASVAGRWEYRPLDLIRVLRPLDTSRYLELLEDTALPFAVCQEFDNDIERNIEEILGLLRSAASVQEIDTSGRSGWNGKLAAPILLTVGYEHAVRICESRDEQQIDQDVIDKKFRKVFVKLVGVLLEREDGRFLGLKWLGHLINQEGRQPHATHQWSPTVMAIDVLAEGMAAKGYGLADAQDVFREALSSKGNQKKWGRGTSGTDALLVAVMLEQADTQADRKCDSSTLLQLYRNLLIQEDYGLFIVSDTNFPSWRNWRPAMLFAGLENPAQEWQDVWRYLSEQRRRNRHILDDQGGDDFSFFHVCLGLSLIDWLLTSTFNRPQDAFRCWQMVFDAAFCMSLSARFLQAKRWRCVLAKLFARLPHVFRILSTQASYVSDVAREFARLGGDDELVAWCACAVRRNGIDIRHLAMILAGMQLGSINLLQRLEDFVEWETRPGIRRAPSGLVEECRRLISLLSEEWHIECMAFS